MDAYLPHAAHQERRGFSEERCPGDLIVIGRAGPIWELECDGCGWEATIPAREASPEHRAEAAARQQDRWRQQSGIPAALASWQLDRLAGVNPALMATARAWAAGETSGLLLSGSAGVGKTTLAAAAANGLMRREPVRWLSVPALFARLGRAFSDEDRHDALRLLESPVGLVLDDVDKAKANEDAAQSLFLAVDVRVAAGRPLIVTTNCALSELAARWPAPFGETIASRLAGYCESFMVTGHDRRLERLAA